jgi:hypothetical protein
MGLAERRLPSGRDHVCMHGDGDLNPRVIQIKGKEIDLDIPLRSPFDVSVLVAIAEYGVKDELVIAVRDEGFAGFPYSLVDLVWAGPATATVPTKPKPTDQI